MTDWNRYAERVFAPQYPIRIRAPAPQRMIKEAIASAVGVGLASAFKYGKRSYSKTGTRYLKKKPKSLPKVNKKRISYLSKKMNNNEATIIFRGRSSERAVTALSNQCVYYSIPGNNKAFIEQAITSLKFFDPADPANLVTVNYNTGTFQKQVLIKNSSSICIRNNYAVPCNLELYLCRVKSDTNNNPLEAITAGFADAGNIAITDPLTKAKDSMILLDLWRLKTKRRKIILKPGAECRYYHSEPEFSYDTSLVDTHNQEAVKIFHSYNWLLRVEGVPAHDNEVITDQGVATAGVDIVTDRQYIIKYDAGVDLKEIQTVDNSSFTNVPKVTTLENEQNNFQL